MGDEFLPFSETHVGLVSKVSDERHGVSPVPAASGDQPTKTVRRTPWSLAQDDRLFGDLDVESISGLDRELSPSLARHDDLVLGADLYA
jgi:hypothetical protein